MLQIKDTLVSLDLIERFFHCDLDVCLGNCCIEGDAGAPLTEEEARKIRSILPEVWPYLTPAGKRVLEEEGESYIDEEGDLVTSLIDGRACAFTYFGTGGKCLCALEKAFLDGKTDFRKPSSCALYPVRLKQYDSFMAVNFHRWRICKSAELLGRSKNERAWQFLRGPLTDYFGAEWYEELDFTAREYLRQQEESNNIAKS